MDIQAINTAIITSKFTAMELDTIADAVKFARANVARTLSCTLKTGQRVFLTHAKVGGKAYGTIVKVKIKKADVKMDSGTTFQVPMSMLTLA
jgi:hypothetical protein